jgi:mannitol/fructose-specific phosphotransferase system IIA component (Ntr-type)
MKRFQIDMREVLVHEFTVEALSKEDAIARIYDEDLEADYINPICYEVDDIQEMKSDSDYYDARRLLVTEGLAKP